MKNAVLFACCLVAWLVFVLMMGMTSALRMISAANTIENIAGVALLLILAVISVKTRCFTSLSHTKTKENEK